MWMGLLLVTIACMIWGGIFVIPSFLSEFSPAAVALGRYCFYGLFSLFIIASRGKHIKTSFPKKLWMRAIFTTFFANILYYFSLVSGLRYATPIVTTLLIGLTPLTIAFYGNWKAKEVKFRALLLPSFLLLFGIIVINIAEIVGDTGHVIPSYSTYVLGIFLILVALFSWSWFAVDNAQFLKAHPEIQASNWATMLGASTLVWIVILAPILYFFTSELDFLAFSLQSHSPAFQKFLLGTLILGTFCSWLGLYFWNKASSRLPISLSGQMLILETAFSLFYLYLLEKRLPTLYEALGTLSIIAGILWSIQLFRAPKKSLDSHPAP